MYMERAKEYYELDLIERAEVRAPFLDYTGWTIEFYGKIGNAEPELVRRRGGCGSSKRSMQQQKQCDK